MKLTGGYKYDDTDDLNITPYIFLVNVKEGKIRVIGLGLCIFNNSFYLALGFNLPDKYKRFTHHE